MTDLEITRLCAEAMGGWCVIGNKVHVAGEFDENNERIVFDPLHDDAQAMALVKKFCLRITIYFGYPDGWIVATSKMAPAVSSMNDNLNRAICLCVAKMQAAK